MTRAFVKGEFHLQMKLPLELEFDDLWIIHAPAFSIYSFNKSLKSEDTIKATSFKYLYLKAIKAYHICLYWSNFLNIWP